MRRSEQDPALLDRLLTALEVRVEAFAVCEVERGWRLALDPMDAPSLHYVLAGAGLVRAPDAPPLPVSRHSVIIIVPPRLAHSLEVPTEAPARPERSRGPRR